MTSPPPLQGRGPGGGGVDQATAGSASASPPPAPPLKGRGAIALLLVLLVALVVATAPPAMPDYNTVRAQWRSSEARLLARDGTLLELRRADARVRKLDWVPLSAVAAPLVAAAVRGEDRRFDAHRGVDWRAVGGALRDRLAGRHARGASTITMQLAGLLDPSLGRAGARSPLQKVVQARAAWAIEARWTKPQILEAWLNLLPFRGDLVGIDAAARSLAGRPPGALDAAQSAVLAGLIPRPNAPPAAVARRACALAPAECARMPAAAAAMLGPRSPLPGPGLAPQLAERLLAGGRGVVRTTIDAALQRFVADALTRRLAGLSARNVRDGAALVVDVASGEVLAYVGSAGAMSQSGAVDGVAAPRQAGSTLKPFLYGLALERRLLTAASILDDAPVDLDTASGLYIPQNYDRSFRGPVSVRSALGNSLNVPAVRTLLLVGVDAFRDRLYDSGFRGIAREGDYYGYSLALGSAEVTLAEQAAAYRSLARGGRWGALRVEPGPPAPDRAVLAPAAAAIVTDILADPAARTATFGADNALALPFPAAVKTGTSKALRDNWCIGFSPRFVVAVWIGNFEGDSMGAGVSGVSGAAPVWREIMLHLGGGGAFGVPRGVARGGVRFEPAIEPARSELFAAGTELAVARLATAAARARIVAPANNTVIALDPDIPPARQQVGVRTTGADASMRLLVDGRPIGVASAAQLWQPVPGNHRLTLVGAAGKVLDRIQVSVR